jgi:energy-coupling factor transporter ATP-binding protein EcfA2
VNPVPVSPQPPGALLPRWANEQDSWIRAVVGDVLANGVQCPDADIGRYLKHFLAEKRLSEDPIEITPKLEERQVHGNPLDTVRLNSLTVGDGVNAIKVGSQIDFAPGVTVIFGENGSGKSGFVRILKRAAGVRTAEDILHNVLGTSRPIPSATFSVTVASNCSSVEWHNELGVAPLNRCGIFDARGARLHVEEDLSYVYTPGELAFFPIVQNAIERVRTALEGAITTRTPGANALLASFERGCSIYSTIETLGPATDIDDFRKYALLPDNVDSVIESLKAEINALKSTNIQIELRRARERTVVVDSLRSAIQTAKVFDITGYESHLESFKSAVQRRDEAGSNAFAGLTIPGVLSDEWRSFVEAGEEYLKKHVAADYPHEADSCIYCRQPFSATALELIKKYRDFSNNEIRVLLDRAKRTLSEYVAPITALNADRIEQQFSDEISGDTDILKPLAPIIHRIKILSQSLASNALVTWPHKDESLAAAESIVSEESTRLSTLAAELQTSVEQRQQALRKKQAELIELEGKRTTSRLLAQIEKRVADAKWVSRASIVTNGMSTVLRSLTDAAKDASEELLNKGFENRFQDECRRLRAPNVTLNFPGRQGQVTRRKMVATFKPNQILSEGEQKAIALADFLAEVTAVPASSPVVFDDPITSMDYRRIHEVCDRVVALAADHQIIVFTHNIWFAAELLAKADKKKWKYYDIRSEGGESGVLSSANHPRVDTIAQVSARVKKMIDAASQADGEVKAALVEKGYEELRGLCEIVVEHEMLKGVVQRYAPNVMMTKVEKINVGELQNSMSAVMPAFEKACRYIASHSQPIETQGIRPTLDELKTDFAAVLKAREPHKE